MESLFDPSLFISKDYNSINFSYKSTTQDLLSLKSSTTDFDLTGQIIWPAAEFLSKYLIDNPSLVSDKVVLELGSGAGLSGLIASQFAKTVYLTDGNDIVVELLIKNLQFCTKNNAQVKRLCWGIENTAEILKEIGPIDVIIGADVLFWPDSIKPLVETLKHFKDNGRCQEIWLCICYRTKQSEDLFDSALAAEKLVRKKIACEKEIYLYKIEDATI